MKPEPFRIKPIFTPRIWGARSLAPLYPEKTNLTEPIGEVWLTGVDCKVATGPFAGKTLGEAWRDMPPEWRGSRFTEAGDFPILVKFIFPNDKLSIQVHPDDAYAAAHEKAAGGRGKTEMWYVVSAEPGAKVLVGLKAEVSKEVFLKALASHTLENLFEAYAVSAGDTFFVPARTPHTIGPGMVICEVQEYSDLTYRVYDYGRVDASGKPRELHIEKALAAMNFDPAAGGRVTPRARVKDRENFRFNDLVDCPYFSVSRIDVDRTVQFKLFEASRGKSCFQILVVLSGEGLMSCHPPRHAQGTIPLKASECWLIPADTIYSIRTEGRISLLTAFVP